MTKPHRPDTTHESGSFLYGATVLGHCVEGANYASDWWRWEQRPGRIAGDATSQTAADHWHRYPDDFKLASKLGLNCLLISIEWSRIEPKPGEFDRDALEHYARALQSLNKHDITPIIALQAISLPAWFADAGGWAQKHAPDRFAAYVGETVSALAAHCSHWVPLYRVLDGLKMGLLSRAWPPGHRNPVRLSRSLDHARRAAIEASSTIRSVNADARIGHSIGVPDVLPFDDESPWDYRAAKWFNAFESAGTYVDPESMYRLGDAIEDSASHEPFHFWVMPLPGRRWLRFSPTAIREGFIRPVNADGDPANYLQRKVDAGQIEPVLRDIQLEDKPVLFVGGAHDFADDRARCAYILDHIEAIQHCKDNSLDVMGYVHESYLDGFEWDRGYSTRRGLLHVDWETLARTPNQSAYLLGDIARQGGITPGAIRKHCPGWESKLEAVR